MLRTISLTTSGQGTGVLTRTPQQRTNRLCALIYGTWGSGKTYLAGTCSQHPDMAPVLVIGVEDGSDSLKDFTGVDEYLVEDKSRGPRVPESIREVERAVQDLARGDHKYQTVVVDSLTRIYHMAVEEESNKGGNDPRQHYQRANNVVDHLVWKFRRLPLHVVLLAGRREEYATEDKTQQLVEGPALTRPALSPAICDRVAHTLDHVWHLRNNRGRRTLYTTQAGHIQAKSRGGADSILGPKVENPNLAEIFTKLQGAQQ